VDRLLTGAGGPVRVGAVGGSISYGHGASQLGVTDWFARLGNWLPRAFPRAKLEFHNGCVPATPAAFMTLCLEHYLDPLADLVFVEVGVPAAPAARRAAAGRLTKPEPLAGRGSELRACG
jgi:UDP-glucose:glycoprotein glucosyltransferase